MGLTTDHNDPRLTHGVDEYPLGQAPVYLVLSDEDRARGRLRPLRWSYWHTVCGQITSMTDAIAETYATDPGFYGATFCATCRMHRPVGADGEFHWVNRANPHNQDPEKDPKVGT